jgi:hypothetical protein
LLPGFKEANGAALAKLLLCAIVPVLVAYAGLIVHEGGHGAAAWMLGGGVTRVVLFPGIQILPTISEVPWNGVFGSISYSLPAGGFSNWDIGFIRLMGAGTTALLALIASMLILILKNGFPKNLLLIVAGLWPLDLLSYSIFPHFGLRHWVLFGGLQSEPYEGAMGMGISQPAYFAALGLYTIGIYSLVCRSIILQKKISPRESGID